MKITDITYAVSYTHLDVYKRQFLPSATDSDSNISPVRREMR